jgi:hypothetical protein
MLVQQSSVPLGPQFESPSPPPTHEGGTGVSAPPLLLLLLQAPEAKTEQPTSANRRKPRIGFFT